jgi:hypothetical protein
MLNLAGARLRRVARHWRTASRVAGQMGRKIDRQREQLANAPALTRARVQRGRAALERAQKRLERFDEHVLIPYATERQVKRELARAASGRGPIVVGPWTSEVGYEALYWVPFLHWAADRYRVSPDRLIVLSRGGTQAWYRGIASRYVEIFDLMPPEEFAAQLAARRSQGDQKQMQPSAFDAALVRRACERLGLPDAPTWHPGLMFQMFRAFWHGGRSLDHLLRHTDFRRMHEIANHVNEPDDAGSKDPAYVRNARAGESIDLPAGYAAVKFYTGPALPDTPDTRAALRQIVERLAARMPVVVLDTPWSLDEHQDYAFDELPGVTTLRPSLDPPTNLALQTQVIAGARTFVGTCGGLAWLAPLLGVETVAVYADDRYLNAHLYAARYAYRRTKAARFAALNIAALR